MSPARSVTYVSAPLGGHTSDAPTVGKIVAAKASEFNKEPQLSTNDAQQVGGAARNHVGRRVCPRPRNDPWHHGGVRHAQTHDAVHAKLRVDHSELVHADFARADCVPKARRGKSGKFLDLLGARLGPWNEFALAQTVEGMLI